MKAFKAHNLPAEEAVNLVKAFTESGRTAKVIGQEARHRGQADWKCKPCKQAAEKLNEEPLTAAEESAPPASQE